MKKIVTVQDISCVGKCSLTVALPIISAMGVEAAIIPTAVLSTHTQFKGFTFCDLTDEITPITEHWKQEKITFDALYTGYLGSSRQISLMKDFFRDFGEGTLKFVDPAMGDGGKLYVGFTPEFAKEMATLCAVADVIVPNVTEASFMLGEPYLDDGEYDEEYIRNLLRKLCDLGAGTAILTGVTFDGKTMGAYGLDGKSGCYFSYFNEKLPVKFHGTGDIFSSACVGAMVRGCSMEESIAIAADYTRESIALTLRDPDGTCWYGVNFEEAVPMLLERLKKANA